MNPEIEKAYPDVEQVLIDCLEYFEERQDADCEGDPLEFVPNEEMRLAVKIRQCLGLSLV